MEPKPIRKEFVSGLNPCPDCGDTDFTIHECPTCGEEKRDCCQITGKNVECNDCENGEGADGGNVDE